jgi:hypothetical protein
MTRRPTASAPCAIAWTIASRMVPRAVAPALLQLAIRGEDPHDLRLRKLGAAPRAQIAETLPGAVSEWRGKLTRGRWELYCSLPGHKKAGMRAVLTVR